MCNPILIFSKLPAWEQVNNCPMGCFMQNKKKCKCGSFDVVYVVQQGRSKKLDYFCSDCLPVVPIEDTEQKKNGSRAIPAQGFPSANL